MKYILLAFAIIIGQQLSAQKEAITTLTTIVFDEELPLNVKDKKTHANNAVVSIPADFWNQFERIDAIFISTWTGVGEFGQQLYAEAAAKIKDELELPPMMHFAEKDPKLFTHPRKQTGFGTELVLLENESDERCLAKYAKKKIAPKGMYPCMIKRSFSTTAVDFMYRFALPRQYYTQEKCPSFRLFLRTSSKADTVVVNAKIAVTIQGKRHTVLKQSSMDDFLRDAIINGMKADGFPKPQARWIVENPAVFFVGKCPICMPVEAAMRSYIDGYEAKESKVPADLLDGLVKPTKEEKQAAFSAIVKRYVDMHFEALQLNIREKTEMLSLLEAARKQGMELKSSSFGPFCPSCDGACGVKK